MSKFLVTGKSLQQVSNLQMLCMQMQDANDKTAMQDAIASCKCKLSTAANLQAANVCCKLLRLSVVSEQDELPSKSVGLDFRARLDGGRMYSGHLKAMRLP
ncbi:hypothetical protein Tco_0323508 [Tanacetum coccineum]